MQGQQCRQAVSCGLLKEPPALMAHVAATPLFPSADSHAACRLPPCLQAAELLLVMPLAAGSAASATEARHAAASSGCAPGERRLDLLAVARNLLEVGMQLGSWEAELRCMHDGLDTA